MNRLFGVVCIAFILLSCNAGTEQKAVPASTDSIPSVQQIVDAYLYLYGRYLVIQQENHDINVEKVGYNKIKYNPLGSAQFVNPNLDVAYLEAWIAVDSSHAVILNIPKVLGRYYTAQILNGWGEVITNINERNFPKTPYGQFAFVLAGTNPKIPANAVRIELPSGKAKMLARVELKGTPAIAQELQKKFTLIVPNGIKIDRPMTIPEFTPAKPIGGNIFQDARAVIASYPDVMPKAKQMQEEVSRIETYYKSGTEAKARVDSIVTAKAIPEFLSGAKGFGTQKNGWSVSYVAGKFGDDMLARDIINYGGLWANSVQEAIYFVGLTDSSKQLLNGSNTYEINFPPDALPDSQVNAFWSVTLYSVPDYRVVENPLKRYNLNNMSALKKNSDGSVAIWLAPRLPSGVPKSNWLPTPEGKGFSLTMRMYVAKQHVLNGQWFPAPIKRLTK